MEFRKLSYMEYLQERRSYYERLKLQSPSNSEQYEIFAGYCGAYDILISRENSLKEGAVR